MPNQPVFGTLYTLDRFVYRQNSTLLYCTIKEIIILKIACFGVIYVPFSRVITRYNVYFFTREVCNMLGCYSYSYSEAGSHPWSLYQRTLPNVNCSLALSCQTFPKK